MDNCMFCHLELEPQQKIVLQNDYCMFLQLNPSYQESQLFGAGVIVPKAHRETVFDLTKEEWLATYDLLQEVKNYLDIHYQPDGYNLGWNCNEVGGQHIFHAHFHILPRYKDEAFAYKGIRYFLKNSENKK
ncbi:HIT family protein [Staphylococcus kloosii]|uniref:HIT family protein n=1 Tax=Staphylococcus kloosii TaxID=29384 RepID=UPI0018A0F7BD|nr:HIT family protein [Staphylococcus kloosii]MBF7023112.1 HIT family protein [Staphylococcus kloosii]